MLRPLLRISQWKIFRIELLDMRHLLIDVWQQFSNLIELWSYTKDSPSFSHFFFNTKIHESLAPGVTVWWIKFLLLPQHPLKSPLLGWISLTEGLVYPRSYTTEPRKVKLIGEIFQLCAWEMFPVISWNVSYFSSLSHPPHMFLSGRRGKRRSVFSFILSFYVPLWDLWTQFNYGTFQTKH